MDKNSAKRLVDVERHQKLLRQHVVLRISVRIRVGIVDAGFRVTGYAVKVIQETLSPAAGQAGQNRVNLGLEKKDVGARASHGRGASVRPSQGG